MNFIRRNWLYLLIATLPFERIPSLEIPLAGHNVTVRLSLIVASVALALFGWRLRPTFSPKQPAFWMGTYIIVAFISFLVSINRARSITAIIATILVVLIALLISENFHKFKLEIIFKVLTIVSVFTCLIGVYQFIGDSVGLPTAATGLKDIYTKSVFGFPRIQSTGLEPLFFANFLLIPLVLTMSFLYTRIIWGGKWYGVLFLYVLTMALTLSRGGFAASIFAGLIIFIFLIKLTSPRRAAAVVAVMLLAIPVALGSIYASGQFSNNGRNSVVSSYVKQSTHVTSESGSPDNDRVTNRRLAIKAFKEHPIFGVGIGGFGTYAKQNELNYRLTNGEVSVNNEYLEILAETGIIGGISLLMLLIIVIVRGVRGALYDFGSKESIWIISLLAIILGFAVQYYAFSTLYIPHIWVILGILIGLAKPKVHANRPKV